MPYVASGDINLFGPVPKIEGICTCCWVWTGKRKSRNGYGRMRVGGKERAAHRVIYEWLIGPIPDKRILDHRCRNRACVNPWHMEPVTHRINTLRGDATLFKRPEDYYMTESERTAVTSRPIPPMRVVTKGWGVLREERVSVATLEAEDREKSTAFQRPDIAEMIIAAVFVVLAVTAAVITAAVILLVFSTH